jgi:hypothetical protein
MQMNLIGSVVTVAPASASARPGLTRPETEIDGRMRSGGVLPW